MGFKIDRQNYHGKNKSEIQVEVEQKILEYKSAQVYQAQNGGPGPVASYDVMAIVNEYQDQFDIDDDPARAVISE